MTSCVCVERTKPGLHRQMLPRHSHSDDDPHSPSHNCLGFSSILALFYKGWLQRRPPFAIDAHVRRHRPPQHARRRRSAMLFKHFLAVPPFGVIMLDKLTSRAFKPPGPPKTLTGHSGRSRTADSGEPGCGGQYPALATYTREFSTGVWRISSDRRVCRKRTPAGHWNSRQSKQGLKAPECMQPE
ncbi:hypothetical protein F5141DRAFT_649711 [Pisolithus sp. B1]|nr:hypothetical protein F5141DRAFT_649711 [Pisolithus sp. B1]